ncbi:gfo/Idh/MocA family oxidoreductase [Permianibacter sp. IMCC34836]|uniref:Gfo/Idh/MocA family protein n=1 Tax=Permianibacter fluminis TaxID=2738515 RepID=UPI001555EF00|nr:Gfo/Idh/MocA family oxidoreductase [Permianibacter fluminis]NQD37406.1 gfo/Idh/MocA family oxidoreductase [Permianibacter fluminis]
MILLVGCGPMAISYAQVLVEIGVEFVVVGRSARSAQVFKDAVGKAPISGGVELFLQNCRQRIDMAIVAVDVFSLASVCANLISCNVNKILVEKPGAYCLSELIQLNKLAEKAGAQVYVAYNRRFYASVQAAKRYILEDGGVSSFSFEVSEWGGRVSKVSNHPAVKENWFLANTSHVVDLAFYLGGQPKDIDCRTSGSLAWHPASSIFSGSGVSYSGALFSYSGNWVAPGRWCLEVLTSQRRLVFRPLETLKIQNIGSMDLIDDVFDDSMDKKFKPGLYLQVSKYIHGDLSSFPALSEHVKLATIYARMAGYETR